MHKTNHEFQQAIAESSVKGIESEKFTRDGFQLEIGHKSQVVLSAIKLLFIHEFLVGDEMDPPGMRHPPMRGKPFMSLQEQSKVGQRVAICGSG